MIYLSYVEGNLHPNNQFLELPQCYKMMGVLKDDQYALSPKLPLLNPTFRNNGGSRLPNSYPFAMPNTLTVFDNPSQLSHIWDPPRSVQASRHPNHLASVLPQE